ncbi:MAG TPA: hypothetical protein EYP23_07090, partial [Thermoplasmata archaeon]|nr:hypothetical protein [Thermoplasmata archaeon]
ATSDGKSSLKKVQEFIVSVNKYYDFDISIEGDANVEVEPGQVAIFNISVENKGTGDHRIYFDVNETNIPAGESWSVLKSDPFLKVGETKTVQIKITVDEDAVEQKDGIPFKVTATSEKDSRIVRELTIKVIVKQKFDLDISTTAQKKFVDPGTNVSYHIEVWNKGTGEDTFYIETLGTIPEEFTVTIEPTSVTLGADQKTNVTITIDVEKDAANQEKTLTIRAYSDGDPNVEDTQDIIVSVNEYYEFKFTLASDDTKKADPGDEVVFYFTIENTGTGDDTIRFEVDTSNVPFVPGSEPPRKEQWGVVMSEVAVKAGEKKSVSLTITVDDKAQEQKDGILFNITAISTEDTHTPPFTKTSRVTVQVNQTYAVSFTQTTYEKTVDPGTDARFEVTLKNTGTGTDTFEVNIYDEEGTGWELSNDYVAREIGPQETITFNVTIKVKADAQPVPKEFRVMAKSKEAKENKDLWVSENATLKLTVNPSYGVEFSSSSQLQYAYPSYGNPATLTFSVMITNTGTTTDDFRCEINATYTKASVYDWAEITQGSVINGLGAGKTQTIQIRITVRPYDEDHDATP